MGVFVGSTLISFVVCRVCYFSMVLVPTFTDFLTHFPLLVFWPWFHSLGSLALTVGSPLYCLGSLCVVCFYWHFGLGMSALAFCLWLFVLGILVLAAWFWLFGLGFLVLAILVSAFGSWLSLC